MADRGQWLGCQSRWERIRVSGYVVILGLMQTKSTEANHKGPSWRLWVGSASLRLEDDLYAAGYALTGGPLLEKA